jgi:hypothetical protein
MRDRICILIVVKKSYKRVINVNIRDGPNFSADYTCTISPGLWQQVKCTRPDYRIICRKNIIPNIV